MSFELRPYQSDAINRLRHAIAAGAKRVILASPTGSGKTEMGFEIIRGVQAKHKKVAFLANRIHLVDQTCRRLALAGFSFGVIQGANTSEPWRSVLVCSVQTVAKRGLPDVDLIVIDEAHACAGTAAYREIMQGKPVVGLTATPYSKGLGKFYKDMDGALFEKVVVAAKIEDLIRDGYLVSADIWAPSEPDLTGVRTTAGDYNEKDLGEAVDKANLVGDIVQHWFRLAHNTPTVVFATNISHSKHIAEQFIAAGVTAEHIDCYDDDEHRKAVLERVLKGETMIICNVGILAEGWDFPACKTLILARPTKSLIRYLQMAGRVLRPFPGKDKAIILDHSGVVRRLGLPWDDFGSDLDDGKPKPKAAACDQEKAKLPSPCPECSFMRPPSVTTCPACGFESRKPHEVNQVDGELVQLTGTKRKQLAIQELGKQAVFSQLRHICQERGYKPGWAAANYREIFGVWPRALAETEEEPSGEILAWLQYKRIQWAKSKSRSAA